MCRNRKHLIFFFFPRKNCHRLDLVRGEKSGILIAVGTQGTLFRPNRLVFRVGAKV